MKLSFNAQPKRWVKTRTRTRASAVLVVLVFLACMALIIVANTNTLHLLKQELKMIDQQQQKKYGQGPGH